MLIDHRRARPHAYQTIAAPMVGDRRSRGVRESLEQLDLQSVGIQTLEVMLCVAAGDTNAEIARRLNLSVSAVKYHIAKAVRAGANPDGIMQQQRPIVVAVLDDNASMREALTALLESLGFQTAAFETGAEYLAYAAKTAPSCLVTDLSMPGMNGIEVLEAMRLQGLRVPTVMVTAFPNAHTRARALAFGAVGYLEKPVDSRLFHDLVWAAVAHAPPRLD